MKLHLKFILFFVAFLLPALSLAQARVVDAHKNPVVSARLTFEGPQRYVAITNRQGQYFIDKLRNGSYRVAVRSGNRRHIFEKVTVNNNQVSPEVLVVPW